MCIRQGSGSQNGGPKSYYSNRKAIAQEKKVLIKRLFCFYCNVVIAPLEEQEEFDGNHYHSNCLDKHKSRYKKKRKKC